MTKKTDFESKKDDGGENQSDAARIVIAVATSTLAVAGIAICFFYVMGFTGFVQSPKPIEIAAPDKISARAAMINDETNKFKRSPLVSKNEDIIVSGASIDERTESADIDDGKDYVESGKNGEAGENTHGTNDGYESTNGDIDDDVYGRKKLRKTTKRPPGTTPKPATTSRRPRTSTGPPTTKHVPKTSKPTVPQKTTTHSPPTTTAFPKPWTSTRVPATSTSTRLPPTTVSTHRPTTWRSPTTVITQKPTTRRPPTTVITHPPSTRTQPRTTTWKSTTHRQTTSPTKMTTTTHRPTTPPTKRTTSWAGISTVRTTPSTVKTTRTSPRTTTKKPPVPSTTWLPARNIEYDLDIAALAHVDLFGSRDSSASVDEGDFMLAIDDDEMQLGNEEMGIAPNAVAPSAWIPRGP